MLIKIDHFNLSGPCQIWFQRVSGSMFPILMDEEPFEVFFSVWIKSGMPDWFEYDPEENWLRAVESPFLSLSDGVEEGQPRRFQ